MNRLNTIFCMSIAVGLLIAISTSGYAGEDNKPTEDKKIEEKKVGSEKGLKIPEMKVAAGDWCGGCGVPESICTVCSDKAAASSKEKGDWCKTHKRAETQCFVCHPELKAKWLALKPKK